MPGGFVMNIIRHFGLGLSTWPSLERREQEAVGCSVYNDCLRITINLPDYGGGLYSRGVMRVRKEVEFRKESTAHGFIWHPLVSHAWGDL